MNNKEEDRNNKGFTILEILVVLTVLAILIGVAVPRIRGLQMQANIGKVGGELKTLQAAIESYYINHGAYPTNVAVDSAIYTNVLANEQVKVLAAPLFDPFGATATTEYTYILSSNGRYYVVASPGPNGAFSACFIAGTEVLLVGGTTKMIEDLQVGDVLLGSNGAHNKVLAPGEMVASDRKMYSFNGGKYFVTADHVFKTTTGWAAIDPESAQELHKDLKLDRLAVGVELVTLTGVMRVEKIDEKIFEDLVVYSPQLDGSHEYYADGFLVHNSVLVTAFGMNDSGVVDYKQEDDICKTNGTGC